MLQKLALTLTLSTLLLITGNTFASPLDTGQTGCYGTDSTAIPCPQPGEALFGQDGNYIRTQPAYQDNGDGTVTDLNTGLMWQQTYNDKMTWEQALAQADSSTFAGYDDWRLPTITELYSLINFNGVTPKQTTDDAVPYVDTNYFEFIFGDTSIGERTIDAQYWSSTEYVSTTMRNQPTSFGVNFADGRIKGYGRSNPQGRQMTQFSRFVRGDAYGETDLVDNGNGTITDNASGLTWTQSDSSTGLDWAEALAYCENLSFAGADDWRLPDAKELQGIVDYTRSPATTNSPAIDPLFNLTPITDEGGNPNWGFYWTGTTHLDGRFDRAVYIAFGEALGHMQLGNATDYTLMDVHGAGAQRSDAKVGDPSAIPIGSGPQGDVQRINNYALCVRGGDVEIFTGGEVTQLNVQTPPQGGQAPQDGEQPQGQAPQDGGQPQGGQAPQNGQQPNGNQQGPPQAAINACAGLSADAACSFTSPQGTVNGVCIITPAALACAPAR